MYTLKPLIRKMKSHEFFRKIIQNLPGRTDWKHLADERRKTGMQEGGCGP